MTEPHRKQLDALPDYRIEQLQAQVAELRKQVAEILEYIKLVLEGA